MSWVAVAIGGSAVIGAVSANKASKAQAGAADRASQTQAEAADKATALQREMFEKQQANQQPWLDAGKSALGTLSTGLQPGGAFTKKFTMADFMADPGYQWRLQQGQKAIESSAAARGGLLSGRAVKAASDYTANQASQTYNDAYNRWNSDQASLYNKYSALAGVGQQAVNQVNSAAGQYGANVGNVLTNTGNSIASNQIGAGNASAASTIGMGNALTNGIGQWMGYNNYQNYLNKAYPSSNAGFSTAGVPVDTSGNGWY